MKKKSSLKHTGAFWAFCAPCCILFGVFFLVPLVLSIAFSFTNYDGWKTIDFVGLTNYITLQKAQIPPFFCLLVPKCIAFFARFWQVAQNLTVVLAKTYKCNAVKLCKL